MTIPYMITTRQIICIEDILVRSLGICLKLTMNESRATIIVRNYAHYMNLRSCFHSPRKLISNSDVPENEKHGTMNPAKAWYWLISETLLEPAKLVWLRSSTKILDFRNTRMVRVCIRFTLCVCTMLRLA